MLNKNRKSLFGHFALILALIISMLFVEPIKPVLAASSRFVSMMGDDTNDCATTTTPCATINGAIAKAIDGDTIYVAIGTYTGTGTEVVSITKSVTFSGGWDTTFATQNGISTIDAQGARRGIYKVGYSVVMDYFLITNGYTNEAGGGIYHENGTLTLNNSMVSGNTAGYAGGISNIGTLTLNNSIVSDNTASNSAGGISNIISNLSTLTLNNSTVSGNTAGAGAGIYNQGTLTLYNSTVSGNAASGYPHVGGGIYNYGGTATLYNSTISENTSTNSGGGIFSDSSGVGGLTLNNSTVSNNSASQYGGGIYYYGSGGTIQNSILAGNIAGSSGPDCYATPGSPLGSLGYNLIGNNSDCTFAATTGDLVGTSASPINPLLNPLQNNGGPTFTHALTGGSPAIDVGSPVNCFLATDQRGVTRPQGAHCDIGAFEKIIHYVKSNATGANNGSSWVDAYTDLQSALAAASSGDGIWVAAGTYKPTTGTDRAISFALKNSVEIYGGFAGTETSLAQRNPATNITILSGDIGFPNDPTDNSYHVVRAENINNTAVLDGFTIRRGNANNGNDVFQGGGMLNYSSSPTLANLVFSNNIADLFGGAIRNEGYSSPTLTNVTFSGNSATCGGGMSNFYSNPTLIDVTFTNNDASDCGGGMDNAHSNPTLTNVTFLENIAYRGGGIYNSNSSPILKDIVFNSNEAYSGGGLSNSNSSPSLTNVTFSGNTAYAEGGGMRNRDGSNPVLINVTFSGNSATVGGGAGMVNNLSNPTITNVTFSNNIANTVGGGIANVSSNPTLKNVILWGDTANSNPEIYNSSSSPTITYSIVQGGYAGIGNLDLDPKLGLLQDNGGFTETMALGVGSPGINAGTNTGCPATDQRGVSRLGGQCDIGAYEYRLAATFEDVPWDHWAWSYIEALYNAGVTAGCSASPLLYCPTTTVTRDQMAVFLLKAKYGSGHIPPTPTGVFQDVPTDYWAAPWIEELAAEGITSGCSISPKLYCPTTTVTRDQMAVFLLKAEHGSGYTPPTSTGVFQDVTTDYWAASWIERLAAEGITGGCSVTPKLYCPATPVSRDQMAIFLDKTFGIPLP